MDGSGRKSTCRLVTLETGLEDALQQHLRSLEVDFYLFAGIPACYTVHVPC